ncbi:MAG: serine/threonine-protein kinase, partial [Polyangiaceae bacterium]
SRAGKLVAIKTLTDERQASHDEAFSQALSREASLCVRLNHPAIVQVRAFVEEDGFAALVFEYVEGVALVRLLRFCARRGVRLPDRAAWHVVERVLSALAYAHSQHDEAHQPAPIVHRDVSPSNVLVDWTGGVKLADFGMAKMIGVSPATRVGLVKGTLGCMAPEQARGEPVTERADVYAAALLAWRLATGRTPFAKFKDDEFELLRAMRNPRLRPLAALRPDLPEPILSAIARALEPEVEKRTITAEELRTIVRGGIDTDSGHVELGDLLTRWRPQLVETLARDGDPAHGTSRSSLDHSSTNSADGRKTGNYEEAALAFDDEGPLDGPTFETYSLPSDAAIRATLPVDGAIEVAMPVAPGARGPDSNMPPPPPATADTTPPSHAGRTSLPPTVRTARGRARQWWIPVAAILALAIVCAVAAYVTK